MYIFKRKGAVDKEKTLKIVPIGRQLQNFYKNKRSRVIDINGFMKNCRFQKNQRFFSRKFIQLILQTANFCTYVLAMFFDQCAIKVRYTSLEKNE